MVAHVAGVQRLFGQEGIGRHDRFRHHALRVLQMLDMPGVRIAVADARQVRPGALRPPLERVVVHAFGGEAVMAIAFDLVAERPDHLAVAVVAALAHVDVAARQLERGVGAHPLHLLDGRIDPEQRRDLDDAADGDGDQREQAEQRDVALQRAVRKARVGRIWGRFGHGGASLIRRVGRRADGPLRRCRGFPSSAFRCGSCRRWSSRC